MREGGERKEGGKKKKQMLTVNYQSSRLLQILLPLLQGQQDFAERVEREVYDY